MQTRLHSLVEQLASVATGFVLSLLLWHFVVQPVWGIRTSVADNLQISTLFTVASIARGYLWRRVFNALAVRGGGRA